MHGVPGSGKTTLGHAIASELRAVLLELDVVTAALMRAGIGPGERGEVTYEAFYSVAASIAREGRSVVLDNAVFRPEVEARSRALDAHGSRTMIECICADRIELERRLRERHGAPIQARAIGDWRERAGTAEPASPRLRLDTLRPLDELVAAAVAYVREANAALA